MCGQSFVVVNRQGISGPMICFFTSVVLQLYRSSWNNLINVPTNPMNIAISENQCEVGL